VVRVCDDRILVVVQPSAQDSWQILRAEGQGKIEVLELRILVEWNTKAAILRPYIDALMEQLWDLDRQKRSRRVRRVLVDEDLVQDHLLGSNLAWQVQDDFARSVRCDSNEEGRHFD